MGYNENYIEPWCQYFVECHLPALIDQGSKVGTHSTGEPDELNASHIHGERFVRFGLPAAIAKIEKAFVLGSPPETKVFSHIIAITHFVIFSQMPAEF
jgi:hypothetical protein